MSCFSVHSAKNNAKRSWKIVAGIFARNTRANGIDAEQYGVTTQLGIVQYLLPHMKIGNFFVLFWWQLYSTRIAEFLLANATLLEVAI